MIKFFRRFRQKLLSENKFSKYLLYAIGEIILVVIGILIALQINTWNEERKLRVEESNFLGRLKTDLVNDTIYYNQQLEESSKTIEHGEYFLRGLFQLKKSPEEIAHIVDHVNAQSKELIVENTTFSELKNAGKFNIISNETLRSKIIDHYRYVEIISKDIEDYNNYKIRLQGDISFNFWKYNTPWKVYTFKEERYFDKSDLAYFNDPSTKEFIQMENFVTQLIGLNSAASSYMSELKEKTKTLILEVSSEITKDQ